MNKQALLKTLLTVVLLTFLVIKIKPQGIAAVFAQTNVLLLVVSLPLFFAAYVIRTAKWEVLMRAVDVKTSFWRDMKILIIGTFYGMITPGRVGEVARSFYMKERKSTTLPTIIWEKVIDILILILLSTLSSLLFFDDIRLFYLTLLITLLFIVFLALAVNKKMIGMLAKLFKIPDDHKKDYLKNMLKIAKNKTAMFKAFFIGVFYYIINLIAACFVLRSLNPAANLELVYALPIIILFGNAPITVAGLGLREFISVLIFRTFGESASFGFSFSLLWFIMITGLAGIIGYCFVMKKGRR